MEAKRYDSIAAIFVENDHATLVTDGESLLVVSTIHPDFPAVFEKWLKQQYEAYKDVKVVVFICSLVLQRMVIETRGQVRDPDHPGEMKEVGADVFVHVRCKGDLSNICIGVCQGKYTRKKE